MEFILGTAQFGMKYGITNNSRVDEYEVKQILDYSKQENITVLDSAQSYGETETLLGRLSAAKNFEIYTKLNGLKKKSNLRNQIQDSLLKLNTNKLKGLYFHNPKEVPCIENLEDQINDLKSRNIIDDIGVSIYTKQEYELIRDLYNFDIMQIPISIFDNRLVSSSFLQEVTNSGVKVYARSIFLQGILLLDSNDLPKHLLEYKDSLVKFEKFVLDHNSSKLDICFSFIKSLPVDGCIVGVNSLEQLTLCHQSFQSEIKISEFPNFKINKKLLDLRRW